MTIENPDLNIYTKAVSTKVNENFYANIRMENPTPDVLAFARLFQSVVEDYLMRISKLSFVYYTGPKSFYKKLGQGYLSLELPTIPKDNQNSVSSEDIACLEEYRKAYLASVRQMNIWTQTTKDHAGTLLLYAY